MRLYGVSISAEDCRAIVASLIADGSADALAAVKRISGLDLGAQLISLTPALGELRGVLTRDRLDRGA